jgi:hypothetical protein
VVSVDITNSGTREGDEVVQLYVKHSGTKVVWKKPITLRIGSSSADIRLEQKVAVAAEK